MIRAGDKTHSRLHHGLRKAVNKVAGDGGLVLIPAANG